MNPSSFGPGMTEESQKDETQLVTFLVKDEEFGFDIMSVQEIIRVPQTAKVPRAPAYVEGIANLRGVVLPIIDIRSRFGMERAEETDRTRVLVIDDNGVKTGLRVDRVKQVDRVLRSEMEPPPKAISGVTTSYLDGVVKLNDGERIIMALNARRICESQGNEGNRRSSDVSESGQLETSASEEDRLGEERVQQMVSFRVAREEFAFPIEQVREILRVLPPKQVPGTPDYVLGVLTVRGQILPIIDLRRLLRQTDLAEERIAQCREIRESQDRWLTTYRTAIAEGRSRTTTTDCAERTRAWLAEFSSSSQVLMETLSRIRALNERIAKQLLARKGASAEVAGGGGGEEEILEAGSALLEMLDELVRQIPENIREDQRIVVVDARGFMLGLVVDHVNEVLDVPKRLIEPPPAITHSEGLDLSGVAKLEEGGRLIMLLEIGSLLDRGSLEQLQSASEDAEAESEVVAESIQERATITNEIQLVTFMLGGEEYGIPISQIQEIDRLSKITQIPKAPEFVEGVTNLRGEVIPVLDTRKLFGLEERSADDRTRVIIVDLAGVKTGLIVDSVREVLSLSRADLAPPPSATQSGVDAQFISGIGQVDQGHRMIVLLEVEAILSPGQQNALINQVDPPTKEGSPRA